MGAFGRRSGQHNQGEGAGPAALAGPAARHGAARAGLHSSAADRLRGVPLAVFGAEQREDDVRRFALVGVQQFAAGC